MLVQNKLDDRQFSPGELAKARQVVSSQSGSEGSCVQAAFLPDGFVALRDSTQPDGQAIVFSPEEWVAFTGGVKNGEFDLPVGA